MSVFLVPVFCFNFRIKEKAFTNDEQKPTDIKTPAVAAGSTL